MSKPNLEALVDKLRVNKSVALGDDTKLIEDLGFDSMSLFAMVGDIESQFGVKIREEDLAYENFETIGAIKRLLNQYA